jgi:chromosome segregation ATPase
MSADALRSCVSRQVQARREQEELAGPNATNAQRRDDLAKRQDSLEADRKALDPKNNAAVKAFNAKAAAFKADREALNRDVAAANARTDKHNALLASIAADCRGRSFYQDDFDAVMKDFPDAKL